MFFYKITHRRKHGDSRTSTNHYREFLRSAHLGESVAAFLAEPGTTSVTVTKISQKAYVKATRPGE